MKASLYYFTVVAEEMSITRAANRLFISQQALSKHIATLEKEYNVILFERTPKLRITAAGEKLLSYASELMALEQGVIDSLSINSAEKYTKFPYGISSKKAFIILPKILPAYKEMHSNVIPSVHEGGREYLDVLLSRGEIDLYFKMLGKEKCSGHFIPLQKDEIYYVVSDKLLKNQFGANWKDFLLSHKDGVTAEDIYMLPHMFPSRESSFYPTLAHHFRKYPVNVVGEMNHYQTAMRMTFEGYCSCFQSKIFCYDCMVSNPMYKNHVFPLRMKNLEGVSEFGIVAAPFYEGKSYICDFIQLVRDETKKLEESTNSYLDTLWDNLDQRK